MSLGPSLNNDNWFQETFGYIEGQEDVSFESNNEVKITKPDNSFKKIGHGELLLLSLEELRDTVKSIVKDINRERFKMLKIENVANFDVLKESSKKEYENCVMMAASQFNILEMPNSNIKPEDGITRYISDKTQGPACALAGLGGLLYRLKKGLDGSPQSAENQVNLLDKLEEEMKNRRDDGTYKFWEIRNGYYTSTKDQRKRLEKELKSADYVGDDKIDTKIKRNIKCGIQKDVEIVFTGDSKKNSNTFELKELKKKRNNDSGLRRQKLTQVYCSAIDLSGPRKHRLEPLAQYVLDAMYEMVLLQGIINLKETGKNLVVLTLLGGGAFGNSKESIKSAIQKAISKVINLGVGLHIKIGNFNNVDTVLKDLQKTINLKEHDEGDTPRNNKSKTKGNNKKGSTKKVKSMNNGSLKLSRKKMQKKIIEVHNGLVSLQKQLSKNYKYPQKYETQLEKCSTIITELTDSAKVLKS